MAGLNVHAISTGTTLKCDGRARFRAVRPATIGRCPLINLPAGPPAAPRSAFLAAAPSPAPALPAAAPAPSPAPARLRAAPDDPPRPHRAGRAARTARLR